MMTSCGQRSVFPLSHHSLAQEIKGLSPAMFHANKQPILAQPTEYLSTFVETLVQTPKDRSPSNEMSELKVSALSPDTPVGVPRLGSRLALDIGAPVDSHKREVWQYSEPSPASLIRLIRVTQLEKPLKDIPCILPFSPREAIIALPNPRTDSKPYTSALGSLVADIRDRLSEGSIGCVVLLPGRRSDVDTAIQLYRNQETTSKQSDDQQRPEPRKESELVELDMSPADLVDARKVIIPLALVLLCALPKLSAPDSPPPSRPNAPVTKAIIANQLHRLVSRWPDGNPPRAALKRVNEYLMSEGRDEW